VFRGVILSEAKNLAIKRINDLRDPSSPSAPQDDTHWAFFSNLLKVGATFTEAPQVLMGKGRFLNQKLGKQTSRRIGLLKSQIAGSRRDPASNFPPVRLPKKGTAREPGRGSQP